MGGLQPVGGAGAPRGSGGSSSSALRNLAVGHTRCGVVTGKLRVKARALLQQARRPLTPADLEAPILQHPELLFALGALGRCLPLGLAQLPRQGEGVQQPAGGPGLAGHHIAQGGVALTLLTPCVASAAPGLQRPFCLGCWPAPGNGSPARLERSARPPLVS